MKTTSDDEGPSEASENIKNEPGSPSSKTPVHKRNTSRIQLLNDVYRKLKSLKKDDGTPFVDALRLPNKRYVLSTSLICFNHQEQPKLL